VLSIGKLGADQAGYYERQVARGRDDYYSGKGEAPGSWTGRGAALLGLQGTVDAARFNAMIAGIDPSDPTLERPLRDSRAAPKVVGFDLTFSAPKSVSVEFATQDAATSAQLVAAHESAVAAALGYIEDEAIRVRRGHGGLRVESGDGVLAAAYRHRMSRSLDPQLHTHVVCANVARGPDGRWTALDGRPIYQHARTAGFLYQAHLRAEVRDRLGWEWGPVTNGTAELMHVPAGILTEFSRRRHDITSAAEQIIAEHETRHGPLSDGARTAMLADLLRGPRAQHLALATRERKHFGDEHTWRDEVLARASEHGYDQATRDAAVEDGRRRLEQADLRVDDPAGVREFGDELAGAGGLTQNTNAFDTRDALREYAAAAAQGAHVTTVRDQVAVFASRGDVLQTAEGRLTTADLVAAERRLIAAAVGRAHAGTAVVDERTIERAIARCERQLTDEQTTAVRAVTTSGNGVDVIEALAGTGKTFTAAVMRQVYEDAGYHVIGVAPTGRAVRELAEEAGIAAWTIDRALITLERYDERLQPGTVVVLDEAGMAPTRLTERLLAQAADADAKVIVIGDSGQLVSVQAGGWLRAVGQQIGAHALTQVLRQRDPAERRALGRLHAGDPDQYLRWADKHARVTVHLKQSGQRGALVHWQAAVAEHGPAQAVLIARRQDIRAVLNDAARADRRAAGALGDDATYGPVTIAAGDRVICRRNDLDVDVDNGTRGTVRATHPDQVVIETDAGVVRALPAGYVAEHVELAYCLTGHGMQGGTVEHATVLATISDLTKGWSYTALSRARDTTRLHIDASDTARALERDEIGGADRPERPSREQALARVRARMLIRDDEDLAVTQLPDAPPAGRPDDPVVRAAARNTVPDRDIDPPQRNVGADASTTRLAELQAESALLMAQRTALPLPQLRELDAIANERARVIGQRDDMATRLAALPEPPRRLVGRSRDLHAAERARLAAAIQAAGQQLAALDTQVASLQRSVGPHVAIRNERTGLDARIAELEHEATVVRDVLADRAVAARPAWARALFGERPEQYQRAEHWDRGVRDVARYRIQHQLSDDTRGLGPEPAGTDARSRWRRANRVLEQTQRRLGVEVDRDRDLHRDR
jgi:conjugative relaxase-like TrwC/TraI family protein